MPSLTPAGRWRRVLEDADEAGRLFPSLAGALVEPQQRRRVLKVMAASLALGGLGGCDSGEDGAQWVPAVQAAPGIVPGRPNRFATATLSGGAGLGIVVEHRMGRPIRVDGNPLHPASLGATDAIAQALILDFYDPDRAIGTMRAGQPSSVSALEAAFAAARPRLFASRGRSLRILTGAVLSPTLGRTLDGVLQRLPEARWQTFDIASRDTARAGAAMAYGRPLDVVLRPGAADVVLGLESDIVSGAPGWVRTARDLAGRRNPTRARMSRLYAAEAVPSLFGTMADHRFVAGPPELHAALAALAAGLLRGETRSDAPPWVAATVADLRGASGRALIHAGPELPAEAHALVHAMNEALRGRGRTYDLIDPVEQRPVGQATGLESLLRDMEDGRVDTLLILDANPVHTVPGFADALGRVAFSVHAAAAPDETAFAAAWHMPMAHPFETWGDVRAHDGTATVMQPQALPLHGGRSLPHLLSLLLGDSPTEPLAAVRETWQAALPDDEAWFAALAEGVIPGTARAPAPDTLRPEAARAVLPKPAAAPLTVLFRPDPYLADGRHANNAWLQELPRPLTKLCWDNPLLVNEADAARDGLKSGDMVELRAGERRLELPVWTLPGLAPGCAVATIGYGRARTGAVGAGAGWDVLPLRAGGGAIGWRRTGKRFTLASTDRGMRGVEHADILRQGLLAAFEADPSFLKGHARDNSLYRVRPPGPVAWGMSVDLGACIGCNACVVACTAENNVPVVGRENVVHQREMHWLRIDRYWTEDQAAFQPMLCLHCEEAPCETVCPVGASVHDSEGLNLQVYNRCVGTRFCSNNCPYKVRRFNFGPYAQTETRPPIARNPDVTVRARGVMEKCTFCVQRIAEARIQHDRDGVREDVVTACQAACPTQVFTFGDISDPGSEVTRRKHSPLDYVLLPEQQTHPRLTYEARIRNPNPAIVG